MTIILFAVLAAFCECNMFNDLVHDDQVVAKACGEKLYRSELAKYIPGGITPEDSVRLAQQYIRSWAGNILFEHVEIPLQSEPLRPFARTILKANPL